MWRPAPTTWRACPGCSPPATRAATNRWWCGLSPRAGRRRKESIAICGGDAVGGQDLSELRWDGQASRPARRPVLLGYCVQRRNVADRYAFAARLYHPALFPSGEQPAYGKQRGAGHLRQLFARQADLDAILDAPAYLVQ